MKIEQLFIAGIDSFLPPAVSVKEVVADGRYDPKEAEETQLESVLVAGQESPPEMAVHAARGALVRSGIDPNEISLLLHASVYYQGIDFYPVASYIHNAVLGARSALALEVKGVSNGGLACLELAAAYLAAAPDRTAALITTADKFCPPGIDRWRSDTGLVVADGAAAMVLSRRKGFARVLSVATVSDPRLEGLHRGRTPFTDAPIFIDARQRKRDYLDVVGLDDMLRRFRAGLRESVERALRDAQTDVTSIARFAMPHLGWILLDREYFQELEIPEPLTTWSLGRRIGHMGAGDQILGVGLLMDMEAMKPGDRCMMVGVGAGFTWTCAVIEIVERLPPRHHALFT